MSNKIQVEAFDHIFPDCINDNFRRNVELVTERKVAEGYFPLHSFAIGNVLYMIYYLKPERP